MDSEQATTIHISTDIHEQIGRRAEASDFDSVEEYIDYLLRVVLDDLEPIDDSSEEDKIISRLQSLGYLDQ
jgi:hypothetical protein